MKVRAFGEFHFKAREEFFFAACGQIIVNCGLLVIHHVGPNASSEPTFVGYASDHETAVYVPNECRVKAAEPSSFHYQGCDPSPALEAAVLRARMRNLPVRQRLIFELKTLYKLKGGDGRRTVSLKLTRQTLAEMTSCCREMLGREVSLLELEPNPPIKYSGGITLYINAGIMQL